MSFWIVYQGSSWKRARAGGYLWAPKLSLPKPGKTQQTRTYWSNMQRVRPGDMIFSGINNAIRAVSEASQPAYTSVRPDPRDADAWYGDGWRLDIAYADLPTPLLYGDWVPNVLTEMQKRHSPFSSGGTPNQGYLYEIPDSVGEYLSDRGHAQGLDLAGMAAAAAPSTAGGETVRQALTNARLGQGKFRQDLLAAWKGECAVSEVRHPQLLRASHIKPWASSNNVERLDPANGLLLSAAYDAAFDALLVSFEHDGGIVLAADFAPAAAIAAGISPTAKLRSTGEAARGYLAAHRALLAARVARGCATQG